LLHFKAGIKLYSTRGGIALLILILILKKGKDKGDKEDKGEGGDKTRRHGGA